MRKKIIGMSVIIALFTILCVQSVIAQPPATVLVYAWTDKAQYKPGETGKLKITVLNMKDAPIEIENITIEHPWFSYNGKTGKWEGNCTFSEGLPKWVDPEEVFYAEVKFTIPTDGRAASGTIDIEVWTGDGPYSPSSSVPLLIASVSSLTVIEGLDTWMISVIAAAVVCTIILAIVVLATRKAQAQAPRALVTGMPEPPPPKPKAKAEPKAKTASKAKA